MLQLVVSSLALIRVGAQSYLSSHRCPLANFAQVLFSNKENCGSEKQKAASWYFALVLFLAAKAHSDREYLGSLPLHPIFSFDRSP